MHVIIYECGRKDTEIVLVQPVDNHDLAVIEDEIREIAELTQKNKPLTDNIYLSLGDKEEKTRNKVMATVGDCIRKGFWFLKEDGVHCTLEWNQGNHFHEPEIRMAKAFAWVINGKKSL